jgi:hypothetical protein
MVGYGGYPRRLTTDNMQDGEFEVTTHTDFAKAAWDEWEQAQRKRKGDPPAGQVPSIVWTGWRRPTDA